MERIELNNKTILVTGAAGFIGANLVKRLLKDVTGATIIGIDNMNDYYDVALKEYRLKELKELNCQLLISNYQLNPQLHQMMKNWGRIKGTRIT